LRNKLLFLALSLNYCFEKKARKRQSFLIIHISDATWW